MIFIVYLVTALILLKWVTVIGMFSFTAAFYSRRSKKMNDSLVPLSSNTSEQGAKATGNKRGGGEGKPSVESINSVICMYHIYHRILLGCLSISTF